MARNFNAAGNEEEEDDDDAEDTEANSGHGELEGTERAEGAGVLPL